MIKNRIFIFILFCSFLSCVKQSPQLPSNKGNTGDENVATLLLMNQKLALNEDSILAKFVPKGKGYKKSDLGFWYKIHLSNLGTFIKDKDKCQFVYQLTSLDGKTMEQTEKQIVIGQKQIVVGLEEGIKLLHKGDSATFIIPWYLGYGMNGNKPNVPPYTSLIYIIKVSK